jgi:hypothetical protein
MLSKSFEYCDFIRKNSVKTFLSLTDMIYTENIM